MSLRNAQKLSTLAAVGIMMARAESAHVVRDTPQPPRMVTASSEEIRAWNAAVDAKKAEKRARRAMKGQS